MTKTRFTHLNSREVETTESFFSSQFINARIESGHESSPDHDIILEEGRDEDWKRQHWKEIKKNELNYEEDVNQYLTLTLAEIVNPRSLSWFNEYLVDWNSDAGQVAATLHEKSKQFHIYKINADFLLLKLGFFPLEPSLPEDAYFDKGEFYYSSAASNLKKIRQGSDGLSDVLEKLSRHFGKYVEILRYMKSHAENYLSFYQHIPNLVMEDWASSLTREAEKRRKEV